MRKPEINDDRIVAMETYKETNPTEICNECVTIISYDSGDLRVESWRKRDVFLRKNNDFSVTLSALPQI